MVIGAGMVIIQDITRIGVTILIIITCTIRVIVITTTTIFIITRGFMLQAEETLTDIQIMQFRDPIEMV